MGWTGFPAGRGIEAAGLPGGAVVGPLLADRAAEMGSGQAVTRARTLGLLAPAGRR